MSESRPDSPPRVLAVAIPQDWLIELNSRLPTIRIDRVGTVLEGIAELSRNAPAALLLDEQHANSGIDAVVRLRTRAETAGVPVVAAANPAALAAVVQLQLDARDGAGDGGEHQTEDSATLWMRFRATTFERLATIENAVVALLAGEIHPAARAEALRDAHRLAGSLTALGFPRGSDIAREIEAILASDMSSAHLFSLSERTVALAQELALEPVEALPLPRSDAGAGVIAIIDSETALTERFVLEAESCGVRSRIARSIQEVDDLLEQRAAQVVVLGLTAESMADGMAALESWSRLHADIPVIVSSEVDTFDHRLELARLGVRGFVCRPASPEALLELATLALGRGIGAGKTVLAVDDDPAVLAQLRELLASAGIDLVGISGIETFWDTLAESEPDLILLDVDLPGATGIELCRVVRNELRWTRLPVLVLTAHRDPSLVHSVFAAGADDYVHKPVVPQELLSRIQARLLHASRAAEDDADPLTSLPRREEGARLLDHALARAARFGQPLSIALLDVDALDELNERKGRVAGDRVLQRLGMLLRRRFKGDDLALRWHEEEFIVVMSAATGADAERRVATCLAAFQRDAGDPSATTTVTAGIAQYPIDGSDAASLFDAARSSLQRAKRSGRGTIATSLGAADREGATVDVAVVEDDRVIAHLLTHALQTRGYTVHVIADGMTAMADLAAERPKIRARVILLDISLPGMDGLSVLQMLAQRGITRTSTVIMLTARATEAEMLQALGAGAQDYVTKPFSLPVLMQRLDRSLNARG